MRKYIYPIIIFLFASKAFSHTSHYEGLKKIEMDVVRNGEVIGYTNYYFEKEDDIMTVKNYTKFKVKLMGVTVFSILSEATEKYENDNLIYFKSNTFQNNKEKYVNLNYDKSLKKFIIDGSSYKGEASLDCIIGNWWNHKIFTSTKQISPLSGSIKEQIVTFVGKEKITINNKEYLWSKGDIFVVPPWAKIKHDTKEESVLFSFSDRPVQELLGLFREKIYN